MPLSVNKVLKDTESRAGGAHNLRELRRRIACSLAAAVYCPEMWLTQRIPTKTRCVTAGRHTSPSMWFGQRMSL